MAELTIFGIHHKDDPVLREEDLMKICVSYTS